MWLYRGLFMIHDAMRIHGVHGSYGVVAPVCSGCKVTIKHGGFTNKNVGVYLEKPTSETKT